jgi:hypothetical protein
MRVSPDFNAIAAPILYHTVAIGTPYHGLVDPLADDLRPGVMDIPPAKAWMQRKAKKVQGKEKDLRYIQHAIIYGLPQDGRRQPLWQHSRRTLVLPSVKSLRLEREMLPHLDEIEYSALSQAFPNASKLILDSTDSNKLLPISLSSLSTGFKTFVNIYRSCDWRNFLSHINPEQLGTVNKIVVIFLVSRPKSPDRDLETRLGALAGNLAAFVILGYRGEMTVVNAESLEPKHRRLADPTDERVTSVQTEFDKIKEWAKNQQEQWDSLKKGTAEKKKMPEVRFMTMKEYLDTHDWADELTEEDVKPWLDRPVTAPVVEQAPPSDE